MEKKFKYKIPGIGGRPSKQMKELQKKTMSAIFFGWHCIDCGKSAPTKEESLKHKCQNYPPKTK